MILIPCAPAPRYLLKNMPPERIVQAFEDVQAGGAPMSMQIARKSCSIFKARRPPTPRVENLSPREYEVPGACYAQGATLQGKSPTSWASATTP